MIAIAYQISKCIHHKSTIGEWKHARDVVAEIDISTFVLLSLYGWVCSSTLSSHAAETKWIWKIRKLHTPLLELTGNRLNLVYYNIMQIHDTYVCILWTQHWVTSQNASQLIVSERREGAGEKMNDREYCFHSCMSTAMIRVFFRLLCCLLYLRKRQDHFCVVISLMAFRRLTIV